MRLNIRMVADEPEDFCIALDRFIAEIKDKRIDSNGLLLRRDNDDLPVDVDFEFTDNNDVTIDDINSIVINPFRS